MKRDQYERIMDRMTIAIGIALVVMLWWLYHFAGVVP